MAVVASSLPKHYTQETQPSLPRLWSDHDSERSLTTQNHNDESAVEKALAIWHHDKVPSMFGYCIARCWCIGTREITRGNISSEPENLFGGGRTQI